MADLMENSSRDEEDQRMDTQEDVPVGENSTLLPENTVTVDEAERDVKRLEAYLEDTGFGFFHILVILITGLATAADSVEIFGVSFVVPIAEDDLDLSSSDKGWLDAIVFVGMMFGGYIWGSLADVIGRKTCLVSAMFVNGIFGLISAFSPSFSFFLVFRFASGVGVGGSQPVVFSYVSEFFTEKMRGPVIIILASCWQPGIIFAALMAWLLLGSGAGDSINFYLGSLHIVHWRIFLVICTVPSFVSATCLIFLTETPAFLYQMKRFRNLKKVLGWIQKVNNCCPCCLYRNQSENEESALLLDLEESSEVEPDLENTGDHNPPIKAVNCGSSVLIKARKILDATIGLFHWMYLRATLLLLVIWFTQSYGYYGLQLWFPEFFKRLQEQNSSLSMNCSNSSSDLQYYQDTLFTALASLPGNIAGAVLINVIGGRVQLAGAMVLSTASVFSIWKVPNKHAVVLGVSCLFSAVTVTVFGSLDVVVMNIYGTSLRSTAFGIHAGIGRIGAILGNVTFGHLIDSDRSLPVLLVASLLSAGALASTFLPPIYRPENRPPLQRVFTRLWHRIIRREDFTPGHYDSGPNVDKEVTTSFIEL